MNGYGPQPLGSAHSCKRHPPKEGLTETWTITRSHPRWAWSNTSFSRPYAGYRPRPIHALTFARRQLILKHMLNYSPSLDRVFHALADPTRRGMVERLSRGPASVKELAAPLQMSLPAVTQHLQVLEASGLVASEKTGRVRTCRLNQAGLKTAEQWITERREGWERRLDRLGTLLIGEQGGDTP